MPVTFNRKNWDQMVKEIVENECVPRMQNVADACNQQMADRGGSDTDDDSGYVFNEPGYVVSVEGGKPLESHDYRATVITATNQAMVDNAQNNSLLQNFYLAAEKSE